jgi:hypothetical protein
VHLSIVLLLLLFFLFLVLNFGAQQWHLFVLTRPRRFGFSSIIRIRSWWNGLGSRLAVRHSLWLDLSGSSSVLLRGFLHDEIGYTPGQKVLHSLWLDLATLYEKRALVWRHFDLVSLWKKHAVRSTPKHTHTIRRLLPTLSN